MLINSIGTVTGSDARIRTENPGETSSTDSPNKGNEMNNPETVQPISKDVLTDAVQKANEVFEVFTTHVQFKIHEDSGKYYVAVINDQTNEVVREIPPKKLLDMVMAMQKMMKGIFVDEAQ